MNLSRSSRHAERARNAMFLLGQLSDRRRFTDDPRLTEGEVCYAVVGRHAWWRLDAVISTGRAFESLERTGLAEMVCLDTMRQTSWAWVATDLGVLVATQHPGLIPRPAPPVTR